MSAGFKMKLFQAFIQTLVWLTLCSRASAYVGHGVKGVFAHYMVSLLILDLSAFISRVET